MKSQKSKYLIYSLIAMLTFTVSSLRAENLKKVMILDFINIDKDENFQYLEASITDAVQKKLKELFEFQEAAKHKWERTADENYIFKDDYYTKTAAMNLGLLHTQDIVIAGGFKIQKSSKNANEAVIVSSILLLDISRKKVLSSFETKGPADNRIWDSVNEIAQRISKEAAELLPTKEEWRKKGGQSESAEIIPGPNAIVIGAGFPFLFVPAAFSGDFTSQTVFLPKDIKDTIAIELSYERRDFMKDNFIFWSKIQYQKGGAQFYVENDSKPLTADLSSFNLSAGAGYELKIWKGLYTALLLGAGYYTGTITLDFSTLSVLPLDENGKELPSEIYPQNAPTILCAVKTGYLINRFAAFEASVSYSRLFYSSSNSDSLSVGSSIVFRY